MGEVLVDTSAWINCLSRKGHERLKETLRELVLAGNAAITGIVKLELLVGERNETGVTKLTESLSELKYFEITDEIWVQSAHLGRKLRNMGAPIPIPDLVISMTAIYHNAKLLHCDSDFERISKYSDLKTIYFKE